jgi:ribosomal protein L37AE/L43A
MSSRGIPFHCPYCGEETIRPTEDGHGSWECRSCLRAFRLSMTGMIPRPQVSAESAPASGKEVRP